MESNEAWLLACGALSGLGILAAILLGRSRGWQAGLRVAGWALIPMAIWLVGLAPLLQELALGVARLATGVFTIQMWIGVALFLVSFVLLGGVGMVRRRRARSRGEAGPGEVTGGAASKGDTAGKPEKGKRKKDGKPAAVGKGDKSAEPLEGMEDIEAILKNRGIE